VCGDFNAVRGVEERRSARREGDTTDFAPFNNFIEENMLIDLPLCGRRFMWFKGNDVSMSRIDRFLLPEEWCLRWPNSLQKIGVLILLALKCWQDIPGYKQFVSDKWKSFMVDGWGGFVLKEKFKLIKAALKEWHLSHCNNIPAKLDSLNARLASLDGRGEDELLSADEIVEMRGITHEINSMSRVNTSICWQQSRLLWLKDGDANSKKITLFFLVVDAATR